MEEMTGVHLLPLCMRERGGKSSALSLSPQAIVKILPRAVNLMASRGTTCLKTASGTQSRERDEAAGGTARATGSHRLTYAPNYQGMPIQLDSNNC
jgi:hypothetical protein